MHNNNFLLIVFFSTVMIFSNRGAFSEDAYFDISDEEIQIQTNFNGKEIVIFGLTNPEYNTLIIIKGPKKDIKLSLKEKYFGIWIETKKVTYLDIPNTFFVASTSPIEDILNENDILKKGLINEKIPPTIITKRNFISNNLDEWDKNFIRLQKKHGMYKNYSIKLVDERIFQTRIFFPSDSIPGTYNVSILQINNKKIISERHKKIIVKKTGVGQIIFQFAENQPIAYGILSILFAVISGLAAATAFRRL